MTDPYASAPPGYLHPTERKSLWNYPIPHMAPKAEPSKDWPRHVHGALGTFREVNSQDELDLAIASGWSLEPPQK